MMQGAAAGVGEAGRRGDDVRSDLHVAVWARSKGGLELSLVSRVAAYYGESIRNAVTQTLAALGVSHAKVEVHDSGALPYVIAARVEAATRAAGLGAGKSAPPARAVPLPPPSAKDRLRRSRLYLPGDQPKLAINAALYAPDAVILDLEDSVHPAAKDAARILVRNTLAAVDFGSAERTVRINQLPVGLADLEAIVPEAPDLILIPKVETAAQVREVDEAITRVQRTAASERPLWLMPILESALGVENAFAIAAASPRVAALTIGLEDYTADLGVNKTVEGGESLWARSRLINAARACRIQPIDSVFGNVADTEGLQSWARRSRALGFEGMGCVHPRQIAVIHAAFAPSPLELDRAQKIVAAFAAAEEQGLGVVALGSKMIDPPVVERARKLVARARAMGFIAAPDARAEESSQRSALEEQRQ